MSFEREWLYLDELLALLGPSPDMDHVEATFRGALDEDALRDRDGTPSGGWHQRFEIGNVSIDWPTGVVLIPWFNRRLQEWEVRPIRPQFRRADWIELFQDTPDATAERRPTRKWSSTSNTAFRRWLQNRYDGWPANKNPPSRDDDIAAAREEFPGIADKIVREARGELAPVPWQERGRPKNRARNLGEDHLGEK